MLTCALLIGTTAEPEDVDTACSIMPLVSTFYAALSKIPIFPPVALSSAMPMSSLIMPPNMKAAVVQKIVRVRRETRSSVSSGSRLSSQIFVGEVDGRAASRARTFDARSAPPP